MVQMPTTLLDPALISSMHLLAERLSSDVSADVANVTTGITAGNIFIIALNLIAIGLHLSLTIYLFTHN